MMLYKAGFLAGVTLLFATFCMVDVPAWIMTACGTVGGVLALGCMDGTGWTEGGE